MGRGVRSSCSLPRSGAASPHCTRTPPGSSLSLLELVCLIHLITEPSLLPGPGPGKQGLRQMSKIIFLMVLVPRRVSEEHLKQNFYPILHFLSSFRAGLRAQRTQRRTPRPQIPMLNLSGQSYGSGGQWSGLLGSLTRLREGSSYGPTEVLPNQRCIS